MLIQDTANVIHYARIQTRPHVFHVGRDCPVTLLVLDTYMFREDFFFLTDYVQGGSNVTGTICV
jgi:hypothetical protein